MSYRTEESDLLVVKLAQWEGQQLLGFLDHVIGLADSRLDLAMLVPAFEGLGDGSSLRAGFARTSPMSCAGTRPPPRCKRSNWARPAARNARRLPLP